jgi:ketosteroid isomerase-like protein
LAAALIEATGAERQPPSRSGPEAAVAEGRTLEIRSYNLKPGTRDRFHQLFLKEALPMLNRWKVDVVAYGPSLHDKDSYFLMRAFQGVAQRQKDEDAFYGSQEWIKGPRERVLADIDSYTTVVIHVDETTLRGLRKTGDKTMSGADDLQVLTKLNDDYITSVQRSDVKRFDQILSDDFLCSMADGSLLDRRAFLAQTAKPVTITNLQAHDVNVRLMGDVAIIHARTSYTTADGTAGGGRYTDVWARRNGQWLAVSAHVTRKN